MLLAEHVGSRLHVCHVSTAGSVEIVRWAKARGVDVTAEVTPHHLLLTDDLVATYDPRLQGQPAAAHRARTSRRCARRWPTARSTPSPPTTPRTPREDKDCEWAAAAFGMLGLETALVVVAEAHGRHRAARLGRGRRPDVVAARADRPARPATAGRSPSARPANLMLVDPAARWTVDPARIASAAAATRRSPARAAGARSSRRSCAAGRPCSTAPVDRDDDATARCRHDARTRAAVLVLEDGRTFRGEAYGAVGETFGEAVFTTGMTGYQETLTDPRYHRQVVVMTAPHIGNTGINDEDAESRRIWVAGYVVRDPRRVAVELARRGAPSTTSSPRRASSASAASTPAR